MAALSLQCAGELKSVLGTKCTSTYVSCCAASRPESDWEGHARDMSSAGEASRICNQKCQFVPGYLVQEQWKQDAHRLQEQLHNLHASWAHDSI